MLGPLSVIFVVISYMVLLFAAALWVERTYRIKGRNLADNPLVYSLALAVYCTTWTYYGSVGYAATSGLSFLTIYLGPTLIFLLGWSILRRLVRIKNSFRVTSIADLISIRYDRSRGLAALVTIVAMIGIMPYIALQLKSIITTFNVISPDARSYPWVGGNIGPLVVILMAVFTIMFGVRRIDPTERHQGMITAVAIESVVKLVAFLAAGIFVTYFLFDGFGDMFRQLEGSSFREHITFRGQTGTSYVRWTSLMILSLSAILFLPRQFHVAVVENSNERHILTAGWLFPLYMFLINIFVVPIAMGGLLKGLPLEGADFYVLRLPMEFGNPALVLLVFLGGFSAATGMIMVSTMALSTMITNHLVLPLAQNLKLLGIFKRRILPLRWIAVVLILLTGYWFERQVGESYMLVNIGLISFAAVLQFAPAILAAIFWRQANRTGAYMGLGTGFLIWAYTLFLPALVRSGWLSRDLLDHGPLGIRLLRPEQLFGLTALDPLSQSVFWSMFFNIGLLVIVSLAGRQSEEERRIAGMFAGAVESEPVPAIPEDVNSLIDLPSRKAVIANILGQYFPERSAAMTLDRCAETAGLGSEQAAPLTTYADFVREVEKTLAGSIGAATARKALSDGGVFTRSDTEALTRIYSEILTSMRLTPAEMQEKIDFYREKEALLRTHADQLKKQVAERDREISERLKAERALKEAEEKYRVIFMNAVEGIFQTTMEGTFISANPALARILGYEDPEDLIGSISNLADQLYVEPIQRDAAVGRILREGQIRGYEVQLRRNDGERIWVSLNAHAVQDRQGNRYLEGFLEDITDRKNAEEEREKIQGQLNQAQKMEAIGTLAGGVAHDFNNMLTAIRGFVELSLMDLQEGDPLAGNLRKVRDTAARAAGLVRQLLLFSRKQPMEMKPLSVNSLIEGMLTMLRRIIGEDINIVTDLVSPPWTVNADATNIEQVVMNLVINSRDAMPGGGTLSIETSNVVIDPDFCRLEPEAHPGRFLQILIRDTGIGMNRETVAKVFDPFFTTKEMGSGLGMAVVYGIVKRHGGWIQAASKPEQGTTFKIYLPVTSDTVQRISDTSAPLEELRGDRQKILLVEDEEAVRNLARRVLEQSGYQVVEAADSEEAYRKFLNEKGSIRLVFSDVVLPDGVGIDLVERMLQEQPDLPVILSSGYTDEKSQWPVIRERGFLFVEKPYSLESLLRAVKQALESRGT